MTTKQQERDALAKIEKILKSIDADGYVNIAFAGCVEDARRNIDEDAAYSERDRANHFNNLVGKLTEEKVALEKELENVRRHTLDKSDVTRAGNLTAKRLDWLRSEVKQCEQTILDTCATPECGTFRAAVERRQFAEKEIDELTEYRNRIFKALGA